GKPDAGISAIESWDGFGTIIGAESVLLGQWIESLVAGDSESTTVLRIPVSQDALKAAIKADPRIGLRFARALARRVVASNQGQSASMQAISRKVGALERIYTEFASILDGIAKDAEGDDLILGA